MSSAAVPQSAAIAVVKPGCPACDITKPEIVKAKRKAKMTIVDADVKPSLVSSLGVQAFPDLVYKNRHGVVHHMPISQGLPKATDIVRWIDDMQQRKPQQPQRPRTTGCTTCGKDGVSPKVWGPPLWFVIHMVALMYPKNPTPQQKQGAQQFFHGLQKVLPCSYCQKHFAQELATMDRRIFDSRDALFAWTVKFHDSVSDRTHSKQPRRSLAYWRNYYKRAAMAAKQFKRA